MKVIITGTAKEIAALVLELQERQKEEFVPMTANGPCLGTEKEEARTSF